MKRLLCTIIVCTSFSCYAAQEQNRPNFPTRTRDLGDTGGERLPKSVADGAMKKTPVNQAVRRNSNPKVFNTEENIMGAPGAYRPGVGLRRSDPSDPK